MSTIFNVRNMKLPALTKTSLIVGTVLLIGVIVAAFLGYNLYKKLTYNTVVAEFPQTLALYPGDKVQIMGVRVGTIEKIEPAGDKMRVTFNYKYQVQGPGERHRVDPEPEPGGVAHDSAGAALHRWPGDGERRADSAGPHPGAGRVRRTPRLDQPHPDRPRADKGAAQGPVRRRHRVLLRRARQARASRSTPRSTACPRRSPR